MRKIHRLSKVITASTAILNSLCLMLLGPNTALAQCDWSKKIAFAIQRRYQTNENACKALLAPADEFNQAHALLENELLVEVTSVARYIPRRGRQWRFFGSSMLRSSAASKQSEHDGGLGRFGTG